VRTSSNLPPPLFAGEFRHALDGKGRITIPSKWRRTDADEFFLIAHQSNAYLTVMPPSEFENVRETLANQPGIPAQKQQAFIRQFYSQAVNASADKQGRLLITDAHRQRLGLKSDVVLVGSHRRFEVWNPEKWEAFQRETRETYNEVADLVGL
jgi:MraZ protein